MSEDHTFVELGDEALLKLLSEPTGRRTSKSKGPDTTVRDFTTWFKLPVHFGECSNPTCIDPRRTPERPLSMVHSLGDKEVCRYCFLIGFGLDISAGVV